MHNWPERVHQKEAAIPCVNRTPLHAQLDFPSNARACSSLETCSVFAAQCAKRRVEKDKTHSRAARFAECGAGSMAEEVWMGSFLRHLQVTFDQKKN